MSKFHIDQQTSLWTFFPKKVTSWHIFSLLCILDNSRPARQIVDFYGHSKLASFSLSLLFFADTSTMLTSIWELEFTLVTFSLVSLEPENGNLTSGPRMSLLLIIWNLLVKLGKLILCHILQSSSVFTTAKWQLPKKYLGIYWFDLCFKLYRFYFRRYSYR